MPQDSKIAEVKKLRTFAAGLRGACDRFAEKHADKKHYDKQGFGFVSYTDRGGTAFSYIAWSVDSELAKRYFHKALNAHKQAIFDSMAQLAEADAAAGVKAAEAELAALTAMLEEARGTIEASA